MNITISLTELRALLIDAREIAANNALSGAGLLKPFLNKSEAFKSYGRSDVERWLKEGLLHPVRNSSGKVKWRFNRTELDSVARASNRHTFLKTEERKAKSH